MLVLIGVLLTVILLLAMDNVRMRMQPQNNQNGNVNGQEPQGDNSGSMQLDNRYTPMDIPPASQPEDLSQTGNTTPTTPQPANDGSQQ